MSKKIDDKRLYLTPGEMTKVLVSIIVHNYEKAMEHHRAGSSASDASYIVPMIWGSPGTGKTRVVWRAGEEANKILRAKYDSFQDMPVVLDSIADKSPEEITGYPRPDSDHTFTRLMPKRWFKHGDRPLIGFLDELAQGNTEQQNVGRGALLGQTIGELTFKPGSTVIAASNLMEDRAGTHVMPTHVRDVLCHLYMRADRAEWVFWGMENNIAPEICSFIQVHGDQYLHDLSTDSTALSCPSPRSWEKVDSIFKSNIEDALKKAMIAGTVGPAAQGAFYTHLMLGKYMPDIDSILAGRSVKLDESKTDVLYMTMCALAGQVAADSVQHLVKFLQGMKHKEFGSFCVNMALRKTPTLRSNMSIRRWMMDNEAEMIL